MRREMAIGSRNLSKVFIKKVTFQQKLEGDEGIGLVICIGRATWDKGTESAKALGQELVCLFC